ncbi:MAG: NAD-dependent epimerase/dehydratase family protein [Oscillospiraceae bacterium]|nr:NAD-dependent epimerase/dehydratase family protein [Oscillospiraceae bacterium]
MLKVLITGGAGFIGNSIIEKLKNTYELIVLDNFSPQIHGNDYKKSYLYNNIKDKCRIIKGSICDINDVESALINIDYIIHLAAETGTGQSMYELGKYTDVNIKGTSNLLEVILKNKVPIKKIILASSRSVYGEGMYSCEDHGIVMPKTRSFEDMKNKDFEIKCPECGKNAEVINTTETCNLNPISYYAFTKLSQEKILEVMCPMMDLPYTILRYQNVYGAGQSLNNPYTGILSIFSRLLLENRDINIFEDGNESRDFVHVHDVASITCNVIENNNTNYQCINVGSGERISVIEIAEKLKTLYLSKSKIHISGDFRKGDIRHNIADIKKAEYLCNFKIEYSFERGITEFTEWVLNQNVNNSENVNTSFIQSINEIKDKGMFFQND